MFYSNNMEFSTFDNDHDTSDGYNCAEYFRGANWWGYCGAQNVNGPYEENIKNVIKHKFIWWGDLKSSDSALKKIQLMIRPNA